MITKKLNKPISEVSKSQYEKRIANYQVDDINRYSNNGIKEVSELTEKEAKIELCDAMDAISELTKAIRIHQITAEEVLTRFGY